MPLDLDDIPVFVKAGAFVPMIEPIQNTDRYDPCRLTVHFYADESVRSSAGQFYDDDGKTPGAVEKKQFELLRFRSERDAGNWCSISTANATTIPAGPKPASCGSSSMASPPNPPP